MSNEELAIALQEVKDRSIRNEGRIKKLESEHKSLQDLATAVAVMAEQMKTMNTNVDTLTGKVDKLEEKPGKRWDAIVDKVIWALLGGIIVYALKSVGI